MAVFEIPLGRGGQSVAPVRMSIALGAAAYRLRFHFANTTEGGWLLDIGDATGAPLVCGIPLVTGADLLEQYPDLAIGGAGAKLFVRSDGDPGAVPTYAGLGVTGHLYLETTS